MSDLLLGARMAFAGGRDGWFRAVLTALGVGIGVALLLLAAAVPGALQARQDRGDARYDYPLGEVIPAAANTLLVANFDTKFRDQPVRGRILQAEGAQAPTPPGVTALPKTGEVVVSPALKKLLDSADGHLFAPRLGGVTVIATIGEEGLAGPHELAFYLGSDSLSDERAQRIDAFGGNPTGPEFGPVLMLLVVIIFVVLLLPIVVFLGAAVRFGGERRDRRMAALRLVGADTRMLRRIAAGEAAAGALLGVAVGGVLFAIGRQVAPLVTLSNISVYASDIRPSLPLVLAIVVAMPALAVAVGLLTLRGVVIEPLGVSRRTVIRRRFWWRLVVPGIGLALLYPLIGGIRAAGTITSEYQIAAGAVLLLIGAVTLLPWLIDLVVRPMRGGPVPWQLAIRRLQLDSGTSARMVSGIAVAVAGTIGLQMLFAVAQDESTVATRHDVSRAQAHVYVSPDGDPVAAIARLKSTQGVTGGAGTLWTTATAPASAGSTDHAPQVELGIGDCAALAEFADIGSCVDGDVFVAQAPEGPSLDAFVPGARLIAGWEENRPWRLPADTRRVPSRPNPDGWQQSAILVTPGAIEVADLGRLRVDFYATTDPSVPDTLEHLRNVAASITPLSQVYALQSTIPADEFVNIQRGLYIGAVVTLLLISVSLLVGVLEQLRERRRLLAMLVAVGTPRGTLTWSVLWQAILPVLLGLVLAVVFGLGLGAVLLRMVGRPMTISWPVVGVSTGLAAVVVLLMAALSLPALWRLMRPDNLRFE
ncbi:MAG TPA: FtsX-like permease family protein [Micromonosporaceae bacterium]|nr:FtsX-like permease family protein [Micromonosporaceae bacterium]